MRCSKVRCRRLRFVTLQGEVDVDFGQDSYGFPIDEGWFVSPVLNRVHGRLNEEGMAADQAQMSNGAIRVDHCLQFHYSLDVRVFGQGRVNRLRRGHEPCLPLLDVTLVRQSHDGLSRKLGAPLLPNQRLP